MEFYTEIEKELMKKYHCRIDKITVSYDGAAKLSVLNALDEAVERLIGGKLYLEKREAKEDCMMSYLVMFQYEADREAWLKEFPGDIRFIGGEEG